MRKVLVVRKFDDFSRILTENAVSVINCPTIATAPLEDLSCLSAKLKNIDDYDGIFTTSAAATKILVEKLIELKINSPCKIYALGKRSFDLLRKANLKTVHFPEANTAKEMLEKIAVEDLKNKKFLYIRGEKSLRIVPDFLSRFTEIDEEIVYRSEKLLLKPEIIKKIVEATENSLISCVVFFSPSGVESFLEQCGGGILHQTKITVIGQTTADFLEQLKFKVDFIARRATAQNFAVELIEYLENKERRKVNDNLSIKFR